MHTVILLQCRDRNFQIRIRSFTMYAKIENGNIIFPPHNDGNHFNVHLDPEWLADHGFTDMSEEDLAPHRLNSTTQTVFSKLAIRRAMRSLGIESKLDTLLNSSDTFRADWTDAQNIDLDDSVLITALQTGGISAEEIEQIKALITELS